MRIIKETRAAVYISRAMSSPIRLSVRPLFASRKTTLFLLAHIQKSLYRSTRVAYIYDNSAYLYAVAIYYILYIDKLPVLLLFYNERARETCGVTFDPI